MHVVPGYSKIGLRLQGTYPWDDREDEPSLRASANQVYSKTRQGHLSSAPILCIRVPMLLSVRRGRLLQRVARPFLAYDRAAARRCRGWI